MLKNYLIITFKVLQRRKFFTFVSLFGISFTLMLLIVVAAFLDHSFSPMGVEHKFDRALSLTSFRMRSPDRQSNWSSSGSYDLVNRYIKPIEAQSSGKVEAFSIYKNNGSATAYKDGVKIEFAKRLVDANYFKIVDLQFMEGQAFTTEDVEQQNFVAIISNALQQKYFGGTSAIGQKIHFDNQTFRIIGVVENVPETRETAFSDIWCPISTDKNTAYNKRAITNTDLMGNYQCTFLMKSKDDMPWLKQSVKEALITVEFPDPKEYNQMESAARTPFEDAAANLFSDWDTKYEEEAGPKLTLAITLAMVIFMLLPSLNLINLNLSRMMERASEIGVRRSFGASIGRLLMQFIIENIIISLLGGLIGIALSLFMLEWLNQMAFFEYSNFSINYRVLGLGFLITVTFGFISGVYPAWRMAKLHPVYALKGGSK